MNGIRCALVNKQGQVVGYFMASPDNDALSGRLDENGCALVPHPMALPGDSIVKGQWTQSPANLQATTAPDPVVVNGPA